MKSASLPSVMSPGTMVIGLLAVAVLVVALAGVRVPLLSNLRISLAVFLILGMAVCTPGIGRVAATHDWTHPLAIAGSVLGVLILVVGVAGLAGLRLPLIDGPRQALIAVAILSGVKMLDAVLHSLLSRTG